MPGRLILTAGYAGSGKTRVGKDVARRLPACYLDKDTVASPLVERLLAALDLPPGDRDSEVYRREIRSGEYEGLVAAGLEAAELGADVLLSAPFLVQLVDAEWARDLIERATSKNVRLAVVWVACDRATLRTRMTERGSPRDAIKLADWANYSSGVDEGRDAKFALTAWRFDNSAGADYAAQLERLLEWLNGEE